MKPEQRATIRLNEHADEILMDLVNAEFPGGFETFRKRWQTSELKWHGGSARFFETQKLIREIWNGRHSGHEDKIFIQQMNEGSHDTLTFFNAFWSTGIPELQANDLNAVIWLALLRHSQRLAICENVNGGCRTPHFIRRKSDHKFCSVECGLPAQRESKRQWWSEHGDEWREAWLQKASAAESTKRRKH